MRTICYILATLLLMSTAGCQKIKNTDSVEVDSNGAVEENLTLGKVSVSKEKLASKGIVEAYLEIPVYCMLQAQVVNLNVREGMRVHKDQVLLVLDDEDIQTEIVTNYCAFEQAKFQLDEILIGQGFKKEEFGNVPQNVLILAKVKSGYNTAEQSYNVIKKRLEKTIIKAPMSGIVTSVNIKPYDYPMMGSPVFKIIDNDRLKVKFSILESEINKIKMGSVVEVSTIAYTFEWHKATVTHISPIVDESGMIKIEAVFEDNTNLMPGMTAIVNI